MFEKLNLVDTILKNSEFSTLGKAITIAGLAEALKATGPFTILAPTNDAFNKIPAEAMVDLMKPENKENLAEILKFHVLEGKLTSEEIGKLKTFKTLQGQEVKIDAADGVKINDARLQARNYEATNGFIHVIDTVLVLANTAKVA